MGDKRLRLAVLSTGRQDWGIVRSICMLAHAAPDIDLQLFAGGMALSKEHGRAIDHMRADGLVVSEALDFDVDQASPHAQAGHATRLVGEALAKHTPDAIVLAGDRFETIAAALAATMALVPIAHLHGGEESEGAFDNAIRHAITKLAHLHLVTHVDHARRVIEMGEDPSAVHVVGAAGLDNLRRSDLPTRMELEARLGIPLTPPVVIVTLHPATLGADPRLEAEAVARAMDLVDATYVVTLPNNDPGSVATRTVLAEAARGKERRVAVEALGERMFWALMKEADAMLGNSSSAIIEAPALALPAVNVGSRQHGRLRGPNVCDASSNETIGEVLIKVLNPTFRTSIATASTYLFGDGTAGEKIITILRGWSPQRPPRKHHVRL